MKLKDPYPSLRLRPGEVVRVKSFEEICVTLKEDGTTEGLAFQAEMHKYCGRTFRVFRRVKKLIIENVNTGLRGIRNTVILDGIECNGTAHGDCCRACFFLWKEAWLARADHQRQEKPWSDNLIVSERGKVDLAIPPSSKACQSISLINATCPLSRFSLKPYIWDIKDNSSRLPRSLFLLSVSLARKILRIFRIRTPSKLGGTQEKTPSADFDLKPGDIVEVRSLDEIRSTLDKSGKNRGLGFTREMKRFCGSQLAVLKPVDQIIVEGTGEIRQISHTVILKEGNCDGSAHSWCPRNCYLLWRKAWLRKISHRTD